MAKVAAEAKSSAWTEEARYQFLLRIIGQLQRNGQSIKWDEINIPGRTQKSLQHQWAKIKSQVAELEKAAGQPSDPSTPTKAKAFPNNSPTTKEEFDEDD
ncbi:hypothetical protein CRV24_002927 [Beauveria bassiana]|uniref:Myb-like domain-containing protein n=1 Tax=Beauveria bassiana (strain ARSEF 2860) TaxID=655819 RepID=J5K5Z6_BEAB2|nr:uncharacterized protein BBA_01471 [Beauveria bassiana ARSEF 2860]EJP69506.1 hypothetical protein BBA_01471 [Beauveria bassiana ARSEF 2860]KAF1737312.1 hypothetical protein CRV24_002927 [Beauveria bassiana]